MAATRAQARQGARRPRPLVSSAYQARIAAATAAADQAAARVGGTPARLKDAVADDRWQGRPLLGTSVRLLAMAIPVVAAVVSAMVSSRLIPRPPGAWGAIGWFALVTAISTVVLVAVDRVARRLLPLAALLRLSMAFPDRAPSRFSVAFKAGTTRDLKVQLANAREQGIADEPSKSAERILTLVGAMSSHDRGTRGHSERVRAFNDLISEEMRLPQSDRDRLRWAALLHDVGKLHVPARILNKPSQPTEKEWVQLRRHPEEGAKIAAPLAGWLGPWAAAIEQHHERWDGGGYPKGLSAEDISLAARIVAVADTFEVITAPRPYKRPVNAQAAREELARCAGSHFDPAVVRAFLNISIGRLRLAMGPVSWLAQLPFLGSVPRLEGLALAAGRSAATAAGTATGVGALALTGVMVPGNTAASHADKVQPSQAAARAAAPAQGAPSVSTGGAADPGPPSPSAPAPVGPDSSGALGPPAPAGSGAEDPVDRRSDGETGTRPSEAHRGEASPAPQPAGDGEPESGAAPSNPTPGPNRSPGPNPSPSPNPNPGPETRKEFDARQRREKKAFDAGQRNQKKSFDRGQEAKEEAFEQGNPTRAEEDAFDAHQDLERESFEQQQRSEREEFNRRQAAEEELFDARQRAGRNAFDAREGDEQDDTDD